MSKQETTLHAIAVGLYAIQSAPHRDDLTSHRDKLIQLLSKELSGMAVTGFTATVSGKPMRLYFENVEGNTWQFCTKYDGIVHTYPIPEEKAG